MHCEIRMHIIKIKLKGVIEMEKTQPQKRALSPKLQLKRMTINLPVELADWLKEKAQTERKSISLLLTELLEKAKEEEQG